MRKPSVTQLIKLLDKPALLNWANKQGLAGIDISVQRNKWLNAGSSIHDQICGYQLRQAPFHSPEVGKRYKRFISGKLVLEIETDIETEWFTGRYDARIKQGEDIYIIDYKNNSKGVYFENKLQLVAYGMGAECTKFSIVSVPEFIVYPVEIPDRKPYEEIMKALSIIHQNKLLL